MELWSWFVILLVIVLIPSICLIAFTLWIKQQQNLKFEEKTKAWEVFISLLSAITVLVGGAMVVGKYVDEQARLERDRLAQAKRESDHRGAEAIVQELTRLQQKHDRAQRLYDEVMSLTVHLASLDERAMLQVKQGSERNHFEQMYWAKLIGIESRGVESAMVRLRDHLEQWTSTGKKPVDVSQAVLALSKECKAHLEQIEDGIAQKNQQIAQLTVTAK